MGARIEPDPCPRIAETGRSAPRSPSRFHKDRLSPSLGKSEGCRQTREAGPDDEDATTPRRRVRHTIPPARRNFVASVRRARCRNTS